jgi:hypothetical protein
MNVNGWICVSMWTLIDYYVETFFLLCRNCLLDIFFLDFYLFLVRFKSLVGSLVILRESFFFVLKLLFFFFSKADAWIFFFLK